MDRLLFKVKCNLILNVKILRQFFSLLFERNIFLFPFSLKYKIVLNENYARIDNKISIISAFYEHKPYINNLRTINSIKLGNANLNSIIIKNTA